MVEMALLKMLISQPPACHLPPGPSLKAILLSLLIAVFTDINFTMNDTHHPCSVLRVDLPSCAVQPRNDTAMRAHFGCAGRELEMDLRRVTQLVERAEVGEVGEGFYIAQMCRRAGLLVQ